MGGSSQQVQQPTPPTAPSTSETSAEAIQAQIDALPKMLAAQKEFGPQFSQLQLDQLKEFGGPYAQVALDLERQFGGQLAEQTRYEQGILAPERVAASDFLASYLKESADLTPEEESKARADIRGAQSVRGLAESGMGAEQELQGLTEMRQALKTRKINTALSASGQLPASGGNTIQATGTTGQLVQNVTPSQIFGLAASNYATGANIFGTQANMYSQSQANATTQQGQWISAGTSLFGSAMGTKGLSSIRYKKNVKLWV